jgi:DnaK suppressor protein
MDASTLAAYRAALLALRAAFEQEAAAPPPADLQTPGDRRDEEDDQPLAEMLQIIASNRNRTRARDLARVEAALRRLEREPDLFGLCLSCEEEIAPKRLQAMPFVERCVDCQASADGPRGRGRRHLTDFS